MATKQTLQYRGCLIVSRRQWEGWCAKAYPTQADQPFLSQSVLDTLAPVKEVAVADAKQSIDRLLVGRSG
jgi:hypothetical protein